MRLRTAGGCVCQCFGRSSAFSGQAIAIFVSTCLVTASGADDAPDAPALPAECTEKVGPMPDLCQTDQAFRSLPHEGKYSCGPAAFANVLIWMDRHGFEDLVAGDVRSKGGQRALLEVLGSKPYLQTTRHGISPLAAMKGIRHFVEERGYHAEVEWRGWRRGGEFSTDPFVDPSWLREGVGGESNVVLNVGWYRYDRSEDLYSRLGGHYTTLVGYRQEGDRFTYLVHDPAPRSGPGKVTHESRLVPLQTGRMAPWKQYGPRDAAGYFLVEGIVLKSTADVAILDGAIRLAVSNPQMTLHDSGAKQAESSQDHAGAFSDRVLRLPLADDSG